MRYTILLAPLVAILAGCPVTQSQDTPVPPRELIEASTGSSYRLYVPSYYAADRAWPLVITLHGTHGWDSAEAQIDEWKALAEEHGLIVAAPRLRSVQGILPVSTALWYKDLDGDEKMILAVLDDVRKAYRIDPKAVLLTGFSAGGYPMYYVGLRHPDLFNMLVARACNSDLGLLERAWVSQQVKTLPIMIYWGRDDLKPIHDQSWQAYRFLRERGCFKVEKTEVSGGHLRRPEVAYRLWLKHLPREYRG